MGHFLSFQQARKTVAFLRCCLLVVGVRERERREADNSPGDWLDSVPFTIPTEGEENSEELIN